MKKTKALTVLLVAIISVSCTTTRVISPGTYGDKATTVISPNYAYSGMHKIVVMPFEVTGKDQIEFDQSIADKFSVKVMELGLFTIIDKGMVDNFYYQSEIEAKKALNKKQLTQLREELGVELVIYGNVSYSHNPSRSYSNQYGAGSSGDYYSLEAESLKIVDTNTGEVVITSYVSESNCGSLSQEMAYSIKKKVDQSFIK